MNEGAPEDIMAEHGHAGSFRSINPLPSSSIPLLQISCWAKPMAGVSRQVVASMYKRSMAGMVKAPARGVPRRLEDFDPASLLTRSRRGKP